MPGALSWIARLCGRRTSGTPSDRRLLASLLDHGQGVTGAVWLLLDGECRWSQELPEAGLARVAKVLGRSIAEAAEELHRDGRHHEVAVQLSRLVAHLDGEPGRRARFVFELCCVAVVEHGEDLERRASHREAIEQVLPVVLGATGELGARARSLLDRAGAAALDHARLLQGRKRFGDAVSYLEPFAGQLRGELGDEARLLLAHCLHQGRSHEKAEDCLAGILRDHPVSIPALLLLAAVKRARGQMAAAAGACQRVLHLDPGNAQAAQQLEEISKEREDATAPEAQGDSGSGWRGPWIWLWLVFLAVSNAGRFRSSDAFEGVDLTKPLAVFVVAAVLIALALILFSSTRSQPPALGLEPRDEGEPARSRPIFVTAALVLLGTGVLAALVWAGVSTLLSIPQDGAPDRTEGSPGPKVAPRTKRPPPGLGLWRPTEVRIVGLGPEQLPLRPGQRVTLWADIRYDLAAGRGVAKLLACDRPGGSTVEVAASALHEHSGRVRLEGPYTVPAGASRVQIVVPLYSSGSSHTRTAATASLAVETP